MAKSKKANAIARVHRMFSSGEKLKAIRLADESNLKDDEKPDGLEDHRAAMRPDLR